MGEICEHRPVLLIAAVSSRYESAIDDWTRNSSAAAWGTIALESPMFVFDQTQYYEKTMGRDLRKKFFAYENLIDPASLPDAKIQANGWEDDYLAEHDHPEERPLNIDPGYITPAKLVLATTKDRDHRIYLRDGIFAEVTLHFQRGNWSAARWTYPDYQSGPFQDFFSRCRDYVRTR